MGLTFGNLLGLWALAGIPAILLIHFLQKERRQVVASTLFLLDDMQRESKSGIRLERLRNSLPLWLQILAVLLLTWLLLEPRWTRPDSFQRVVVVLDSSASMSAFRDQAVSRLTREVQALARASARTEWILMETDQRRSTLYSGDDARGLKESISLWEPLSASHDVKPALEQARGLLRREGANVFVSSRPRSDLPAGVQTISVGFPIANCGFTGLRIEERPEGHVWHALARNYSRRPQSREWKAVFGTDESPPSQLVLSPGQTVTLSGRFPAGAATGYLQMTGDQFGLDDWMPLARPQANPLAILMEDHPLLNDFAEPFLRSVPAWHPPGAGEPEDLRIATRLAHQTAPARPGIFFLAEQERPDRMLTAPIVADHHPLMRELNWQGLLVQATGDVTSEERDQVLLWQGERPLIVLREAGRERWLFCNFDLRFSNAARLPAFVVLLHRFLDGTRAAKSGFERRNLEAGQIVPTGADPLGQPLTVVFRRRDGTRTEESVETYRSARLAAPDEPGLWKVAQGETALLEAAVHFADAREADFRLAATEEGRPELSAALQQRNTRADFLTPIWLLLLGGVLLLNWQLTAVGRR